MDNAPLLISEETLALIVAAFYGHRFAEAAAAFDRCREVHDDAVLCAFAARSRASLANPPDAAWDGAETLRSK